MATRLISFILTGLFLTVASFSASIASRPETGYLPADKRDGREGGVPLDEALRRLSARFAFEVRGQVPQGTSVFLDLDGVTSLEKGLARILRGFNYALFAGPEGSPVLVLYGKTPARDTERSSETAAIRSEKTLPDTGAPSRGDDGNEPAAGTSQGNSVQQASRGLTQTTPLGGSNLSSPLDISRRPPFSSGQQIQAETTSSRTMSQSSPAISPSAKAVSVSTSGQEQAGAQSPSADTGQAGSDQPIVKSDRVSQLFLFMERVAGRFVSSAQAATLDDQLVPQGSSEPTSSDTY